MTSEHNHSQANFIDTSTECAICLTPYSINNDNPNNNNKTIKLKCGHKWHLNCLKEQLQHAQPSKSRRLLFSGTTCAKCGTVCNHPDLDHLTRKTDALRAKVDELITEQLKVDANKAWNDACEEERFQLLKQGRRTYAFYQCSSCNDPYFGGTIECADLQEGELPDNDRLCPQCSPKLQIVCRNPVEHKGYHVWKCRYCCKPSQFVCYGTVHFCKECHDRNSQRVRGQQQQQRRNVGAGQIVPPKMEAIPCKGDGCCPYPKPQGKDCHQNGPSHLCEQVYHCAWCISTPSSTNNDAANEEPGSQNLIVNPSGEQGMHGWKQLNRTMSWRVEQSDIPLNQSTRTNFVSSFQWCGMAQSVPLHRIVHDPSSVRIEVSAKFMGRTDCPSVFRMEVLLLNNARRVVHRVDTPVMTAPADYWDRASLVIEPTEGVHEIIMMVYGKDQRFWRGNFGSKVADCSVRILCLEEELENILRPDGLVEIDQPQQRPGVLFLITNLLFPIALIFFAWLLLE